MASQPVYSLRIFSQGGLLPASGVVGPTVPAGLVYVLRDVDACDATFTAGDEMAFLSPTNNPIVFFRATVSVPGENFSWRGRMVFGPGEKIGFESFQGAWNVVASGYQLTLP